MKTYNVRKKILIAVLSVACIGSAATAVVTQTARPNALAENSEILSPESLFTTGVGVSVENNVTAPLYNTSGFYADGTKDGKTLVKYMTSGGVPEWQRSGVRVTSTTESNRLTFNNEIDVSSTTKEDILLAVAPISSNPGTLCDFSGMKIYLTDAEDESNYVCIYAYSSSTYTYMSVQLPNGTDKAYRYGGRHDVKNVNSQWWNRYENETNYYFYGYNRIKGLNYGGTYNYVMEDPERQLSGAIPVTQMYLAPMTFRYDAEDKSVWYDNKCLLDLDHTETMGIGKEFGGFTSGRIKLSIVTQGISNAKAQYMVYNVNEQGLQGAQVKDTTAPYFLENLPEGDELPVAGVDRAYPLFNVTGYDLVDGVLSSKVYYKHESEAEYTLTDGKSFTPTKAGAYTLKHETTDRSGNVASSEYVIKARYGMNAVLVQAEEEQTSRNVGEKIFLPSFTATGGSGTLTTNIKVVRVEDGCEMEQKDGYFQPTVAGEYDVIYSATDYLGYTGTKTLTYTVSVSETPVFDREKQMYDRFVSGVTTMLPEFSAYDYSQVGQRLAVTTEITVRGTGDKANVSEKLTSYEFTPDLAKFGEDIEIEYKLYCKGGEDAAEIRTYNAKIVEIKQAYDYLTYDPKALKVELSENGASNKYTRFSAQKPGKHEIKFANPVYFNNYDVELNAGAEQFKGKAEILFTDEEDSSNTVSLVFTRKDLSSTNLTYNGKTYVLTGAFESGKIQITVRDGYVCDYLGNKLFALQETFLSDRAWVSVVFHATSYPTTKYAESICLKMLGAVSFQPSYNRKGVLQDFGDYVSPTVVLDRKIPIEANYGATVIIPKAVSYDDLTPVLSTTVTIKAPSGLVLYDSVPADQNYSLHLDQYGSYEISYSSRDNEGNGASPVYNIAVFDKDAPVIDYTGKTSYTYSVGDSFKIKAYDVYDAVDTEPEYAVVVIDSTGNAKKKEIGSTYTFEKAGRYVVRYVANDAAGNYTFIDVSVVVK